MLESSEFADAAGDKFVFLKLDFPLYSAIDPQISAQNKQLQKKHDVRGFPTIIVLDSQNLQSMGTVGYRAGGPKAYATHLLKIVSDYGAYKQKTQQVEKLSGAELKRLYEKSKELDIYSDTIRIVKAGLHSDEKLFFQLERYRFLLEEGSHHDPEVIGLRQQLLAADPKNAHKVHYQIAVIDFEAFSCEIEKEGFSPDTLVKPLISYIDQFGTEDSENLWRLEMIVSQVYLDHNRIPQAIKFAQSSHDAAPSSVQPEIAKAIRNIQAFAQFQ
ncbi:MAG: hypothetical protein LLG04_15115 [Parachlamydia sp.]|nr:hypothetical protein [Parachlamydia sp.]